MNTVIFTGGDFLKSTLTEKAIKAANYIIAADSGANNALKQNIKPSVVIGDMDSISDQTKKLLEKYGTTFVVSSQEKDETDTQLAIDYAIEKGATEITLIGGSMGDRFDHIIANLFLSCTYNIPIRFINGNQISWIAKGPSSEKIAGNKGDLLSLIPLKHDVIDINTKGLYYPLQDGTLFFGKPRGISNVLIKNRAIVSFSNGLLFFTQTSIHAEEE